MQYNDNPEEVHDTIDAVIKDFAELSRSLRRNDSQGVTNNIGQILNARFDKLRKYEELSSF